MTANGRRIAFLIAVVIVFFLPKKVECGYPGALGCSALEGVSRGACTPYEVEPFGLFLIEHLAGGNVGFAYSRETCR
jgi:hypothetical protein